MGLLLNEDFLVPHEPVAPRAVGWLGMAVYDGPVHALDRVALELKPQAILGGRVPRENDKAGRVAIDAVDNQRPALSVRPQIRCHLFED